MGGVQGLQDGEGVLSADGEGALSTATEEATAGEEATATAVEAAVASAASAAAAEGLHVEEGSAMQPFLKGLAGLGITLSPNAGAVLNPDL